MTIKDIARLSGCSVTTVSRVLNSNQDVSAATRERVMAVVEQYNFLPNSNARQLKQHSGRGFAVIVKGTQNLLFAGMVEQIQQLLQEHGFDAAVYHVDEDSDEVAVAQQVCREYKPPAIVFLGGDLDCFRRGFSGIEIPCVLLTNTAAALGYPNLSSVTTDDRLAAHRTVDYLMDQGHTRIGILGGNWAASRVSASRMEGCRNSYEQHGLELDEQYCEPCRFSMAEGYTATMRLLDRCPDITAIFSMSDVTAVGVLRALRDRGLRVPEDISVMGYDGIEMSRFTLPRLTTIRQDTRRMAVLGVELLLKQLDGELCPRHITVPYEMIMGGSVSRKKDN